jgi:hypothetical protein
MENEDFAMQDAKSGGARSSRKNFFFSACQERRAFVHCELGGRATRGVSEKVCDDIFLRESAFLREPIVSLGTKMPRVYTP